MCDDVFSAAPQGYSEVEGRERERTGKDELNIHIWGCMPLLITDNTFQGKIN